MVNGAKVGRTAIIFGIILWVVSLSGSVSRAQKRAIQLEDLLALSEVEDLQLSPSGDEVLYVLKQASLTQDRFLRSIWRITTDGKGKAKRLTDDEPPAARFGPVGNIVRWSPDGLRVAMLSTRSGSPQIWLLTLSNGQAEQATTMEAGVSSFEWSPDGRFLAFLATDGSTRNPPKITSESIRGQVVDRGSYSAYDLLRNDFHTGAGGRSCLWLLDLASRKAEKLLTDTNIAGFVWSRDGKSIAVTSQELPSRRYGTSVSIYRLGEGKSRKILRGDLGEDADHIAGYSAEAWSPDGTQLAIVYHPKKERFQSIPRIGIYDFAAARLSLMTDDAVYEAVFPTVYWFDKKQVYVEDSIRGSHGLLALDPAKGRPEPFIIESGYNARFSFSFDGRMAAFAKQDLQHPPEIYVSRFPFTNALKLTSFNTHYDDVELPRVERIQWKAPDGVGVEGVLFLPIKYQDTKRYPLLVMVHGGPTISLDNRFEPYSIFSDLVAPYPFRVFAEHGFAVFIPAYRGSASYGKSFRMPSDQIRQPVEDIMSGIQFLIMRGLADPDRLGLIGQSHGSWLGGVIVTKEKLFKAASLFEGWFDLVSLYGQLPSWHAMTTLEYFWGPGSPYDHPERYMAGSPILHTEGVKTAVLMESGQLSLAVQGLEFAAALWRRGVPQEMVIYPKAGHNLTTPVLMLESATRNLDWFDYWILGRKDSSVTKEEQYDRWEKLTNESGRKRF
jgi:dipeptidyl aminopeptidase/acylaminoacyl peptidase